MINQNGSVKRTTAQKNGMGMKALIMGASLAITVGGWAALAGSQVKATLANAQPVNAATQLNTANSSSANSALTLPQVTTSSNSFFPAARTRSSR